MSGSEWQDERLPEEILSNSAAKTKYLSPWEMLSRPEEETPVSMPHSAFAPLLETKKALICKVEKIFQKISNQYLGRQEKQRRLKDLPPSYRALQEGLNYYAGLYQSKAPNATDFFKFLQRNGIPDWTNPYLETTTEHYQFHPLGFLAADVDYLLQALEKDWATEEQASQHSVPLEAMADVLEVVSTPLGASLSESPSLCEKKWPSLYDAQIENEQEILKIQAHWREEARQCWALVLIFAHQQEEEYKKAHPDIQNYSAFTHLKKEVHPDNLWLITVDVYQHFPDVLLGFSKDHLKKAAQALGFGMGLDLSGPFSPNLSDEDSSGNMGK